jgi:hypothetical protein
MVDLASGARSPFFLAFTRSAAREISNRCGFESSTIHAYAFAQCGMNRIEVVDEPKLREFGRLIGYEFTRNDDDMAQPTVGDVLLQMHQYMVATCTTADHTYNVFHPDDASFDMFTHFNESYRRWKDSYGVSDFNDMLVKLLAQDVDFGYSDLFVDEAQDLSPLQWRVINKLAYQVETVYISGDDDQAVHSWAGADPHGMAAFVKSHSARYRVLDQSHRVPAKVHALAQEVIGHVSNRVPKKYNSRTEPGELMRYGRMDIAIEESGLGSMILCRDKSTRSEAEKWLIEQNLPYTANGGSSLFQSRYAQAIRELRKLQKGLRSSFNPKTLRKDLTLERALKMDAVEAVSIPPYWYDYFRTVDLDCKNPYMLSTIHASKGMEADNVVLLNGMSNRVYDKLDDNEYRVWYVGVTRARHALRIVHMDNPLQVLV